jgi:5-formyltetrahydrofolate cyclo-ligase
VTKPELRALLQSRRDALSVADRASFSDSITSVIVGLDAYKAARTVMAYMTFGSEFMTERFVRQLRDERKVLVLPKVLRVEQRLSLHIVHDLESDLAAGPWGIREPDPGRCGVASLADIDFVLVPGLGFTRGGGRLGYGRGYYDRLLKQRDRRTALVAGAFDVQMVDFIPMDAHDVAVDLVVTECGMHRSRRGALSEDHDTFAV